MKDTSIKVGYLISYDYEYVKISIPTIYAHADLIALAIDKDRLTWNGNKFDVPDSFFEWVDQYDIDNKIKIYEDSFYVPTLTPMQCETRERNLLAKFMGKGGWHVQVDSDEYFVDFKSVVDYLKELNLRVNTSVYIEFLTIFKKDEERLFVIDSTEHSLMITNDPVYIVARDTKKQLMIRTNFKVLHQSWGRSEKELELKLSNWGHSSDFDTKSYFEIWKNLNNENYKEFIDFHPLTPHSMWPSLRCIEAKSIPDAIELLKKEPFVLEEKTRDKRKTWSKLLYWNTKK